MLSKKNRNRKGYRPFVEGLEDRTVPAGNVTAVINGGNLFLTGDAAGNDIIVRGSTRGVIDIIGVEGGTTINGGSSFLSIVGFNGSVIVDMGGGSDFVHIDKLNIPGNLVMSMGEGDDSVALTSFTVGGEADIRMGAGNDILMLGMVTVNGNAYLNAETGDNSVSLLGANLRRYSHVVAGAGDSRLSIVGAKFGKSPKIDGFPHRFGSYLPSAKNDTAAVNRGASVTVNVAQNDTTVKGTIDPASVVITKAPTHGTATANANGTITYVNNGSNASFDSLNYAIRNSEGTLSNVATVSFTISGAVVSPTVSLTSTATSPTRTSPIPYTATFSEAVTGFTLDDLTITNGTASGLTVVNDRTFNFNVTPSTQGNVVVTVKAGAGVSASGQGSLASSPLTIAFDTTTPVVTITPLTTNDTTPTLTGTVSETATVVVTVDGQTINATVTGQNWSATVPTALTAGTYSVSVTATDPAGNAATATNATGLIVDLTPLSVQITSTVTGPTNAASVPITITFNKNVANFIATDITVLNAAGSISNFAGSGSVYTATLTPVGNGPVTVNVAAGVANDAAGNANTAGTFTIVFDTVAPTTAIEINQPSPTNSTSIPVTIRFSEDVTGFTLSDVTLTGGTASNFAGSGSVYTFTLAPIGSSATSITMNIAAGAAQDAAGNLSAAANGSINYDPTALNVVVASTIQSPTNAATIPVTFTFSQPVADFAAGDVQVTNGTLSNFTGSGSTYSATITPTGDGSVVITVPAGVATDGGSNQNTVGALTIVVDTVAPTLDITSTASNPTSVGPIPVTFTFSEVVTGFTAADVSVTNGTLSNFAGSGSTYTATITPTADGTITVSVLAGAAHDAADNPSAADTFSIVFDTTAPTVEITSTEPSPSNAASFPVTITFSEDVFGFTAADLVLTNGTIGSSFTAVNARTYTVVLTPSASGVVTISVPANAAVDGVGLGNAAISFSVTSDQTSLNTVITSTTASPTNDSTVPLTITFSKDVTGFTAADITVTNGSISNFQGSGDTYTATLTLVGNSTTTVTIAAAVVEDAAGNDNLAGSFSIVSDTIVPNPTISSASITSGVPSNLAVVPITVTFSEAVTGFSLAGMSANNGTLSDFQMVSATVYTVNLAPTANGLVTVNVLAGAASDAAGNVSTVGTFSFTSDRTAPTPNIESATQSPTNQSTVPISIVFNEPVTGLTAAGFTVSNGGQITDFAGSGTTYSANLALTADGSTTVTLVAGAAVDAAGNFSVADSFSISRVTLGPTVAITSTTTSPTSSSSVPLTIEFADDVTGLTLGMFTVTNGGTLSNLAGSGTTYTATLTLAADGITTVTLPAGAVDDDLGNGNQVGTFNVDRDTAAPTVAITSTVTTPTDSSVIPLTLVFNESVTGLTLGDFVVTNGGTLSNLAGSGTTYTATLTLAADGITDVTLPVDSVQDTAGNGNALGEFNILRDTAGPDTAITSTTTSPTNESSIPLTITFASDVTGLTLADFAVTNGGSVSNLAGSGDTYTVTLTLAADGVTTVSLPNGAAEDGTGNNSQSASFSITRDTVDPTLAFALANINTTAAAANTTILLPGTFTDNSIGNSSVTMQILKGTEEREINLTLFDKDAPLTVANFFNYLDRYAADGGTLFHRTHLQSALEIIQGGGYTIPGANSVPVEHIPTDNTIRNEYNNTLHTNTRGTIAMAKLGGNPNSATSEFFFNLDDANAPTLDTANNGGFTVFGEVDSAADLAVLDELAAVPTVALGSPFNEIPLLSGSTIDANNALRLEQIVVNHRDNALSYTVESSNTSVVTVAASGFQNNTLTLDYIAAGTSIITVTVTDQAGNSASTTFTVTVTG